MSGHLNLVFLRISSSFETRMLETCLEELSERQFLRTVGGHINYGTPGT